MKGKWIKAKYSMGRHECNICYTYAPSFQNGVENLSLYCPSCGARMLKREVSAWTEQDLYEFALSKG